MFGNHQSKKSSSFFWFWKISHAEWSLLILCWHTVLQALCAWLGGDCQSDLEHGDVPSLGVTHHGAIPLLPHCPVMNYWSGLRLLSFWHLPKGFHFHTWDSSAVRVKLGSTYCGSHKGTFSSSQAFAYLHALSSGTARPMKRSFTLHNSKCLLALSACQVLDFCRKTPQKGVTVTNLASIRTAFSQHLPWGPGADGHRRWGAAPKDTWLFDLSACKKK